jgi:hypothetical protein
MRRPIKWLGMEGFRFHDLRRHTGQTLAAATATLADLVKRLEHSSPAAAMLCLHTVNGRDDVIAEALTATAEYGRRQGAEGGEGDIARGSHRPRFQRLDPRFRSA